MAQEFLCEITFAREAQLKGTKLKQAIDDYHNFAPGTTMRTKLKPEDDDDVKLNPTFEKAPNDSRLDSKFTGHLMV